MFSLVELVIAAIILIIVLYTATLWFFFIVIARYLQSIEKALSSIWAALAKGNPND